MTRLRNVDPHLSWEENLGPPLPGTWRPVRELTNEKSGWRAS